MFAYVKYVNHTCYEPIVIYPIHQKNEEKKQMNHLIPPFIFWFVRILPRSNMSTTATHHIKEMALHIEKLM